jgi:biopolymer transport protein ExbD
MKFPRNARIFRGQLDAAPFAIVFFLLVIFLMLGTVVYTPGIRVNLPVANDLPGDRGPVVAIAKSGQLYFESQVIDAKELRLRLAAMARNSAERVTLIVQMDEEVPFKMFLNLTLLARDAGIPNVLLATLPGSRPAAASRSMK